MLIILVFLAVAVFAAHQDVDPESLIPRYYVSMNSFEGVPKEYEYQNSWLGGKVGTWRDMKTLEQFFYIKPVVSV